jgi:hypothetical protein
MRVKKINGKLYQVDERNTGEILDSMLETLDEILDSMKSLKKKITEPYIERIKTSPEYDDKYKDDNFIAYLQENGRTTAFAHKDNTEEDREWFYNMYLEGRDIKQPLEESLRLINSRINSID